MIVKPEYKKNHGKYHYLLKFYNDEYGYYDLFIISEDGHVLYSALKEPDFGTELSRETHHLAEAWKQVMATVDVYLTDTKTYAPSNGAAAMCVAAPIYIDGKIAGMVSLRIAQGAIDEMMQQADVILETEECDQCG